MRSRALPPVLLLSLQLVSTTLVARDEATPETRWTARAQALAISTSGSVELLRPMIAPLAEVRTRHSMGDGEGIALDLEYLVTPRVGIELSYISGDLDTDFSYEAGSVRLTQSDRIGTEAFSVGANYHLNREGRIDFRLGLFATMMTFDDITFLTGFGLREKRTFDDDTGLGAVAAIDIPFTRNSPWIFTASARYLAVIMEGEIAGQDLDLNPLLIGFGIGRRFGHH